MTLGFGDSVNVLDGLLEFFQGKIVGLFKQIYLFEVFFCICVELNEALEVRTVLSFQHLGKLFACNPSSEQSLDIFAIDSQGFSGQLNSFLVVLFLLEVNTGEGSVDEQDDVEFTKLSGWNEEFFGLDFLNLLGSGQEDLNGFGEVFYTKGRSTVFELEIALVFLLGESFHFDKFDL